MGKSDIDKARFDVKEIRRKYRELLRSAKRGEITWEQFDAETSIGRAQDRREWAELERRGGMASHKKNDHGKVPRREIFRFTKAFRKMLYKGEYNDKERDETTDIIDEG